MTGTVWQSTDLLALRGENEFEPCHQNKILVISNNQPHDHHSFMGVTIKVLCQ